MRPTRSAAHGFSDVSALIEAELDLGALGAPKHDFRGELHFLGALSAPKTNTDTRGGLRDGDVDGNST